MMTQEEVKKITDACDIICANCERKYEHAYACDGCVVNEVGDNATNQCIDDGCPADPDENFFDDEDTIYPDPSEDVWDGMA